MSLEVTDARIFLKVTANKETTLSEIIHINTEDAIFINSTMLDRKLLIATAPSNVNSKMPKTFVNILTLDLCLGFFPDTVMQLNSR